jgi:Lar family restriction alleviation protein
MKRARAPDPQPCPFCGAADVLAEEIDMGVYAVCCEACGVIGPHGDGPFTEGDAVALWNSRHPGETVLREVRDLAERVDTLIRQML